MATAFPLSELLKRMQPVAALLGAGVVLYDAKGEPLAVALPPGIHAEVPPPAARLAACPLPGAAGGTLALVATDAAARPRVEPYRTQTQAWLRHLAAELAPFLAPAGEGEAWPITFSDLHGNDPQYAATRELARRVAATDSTVLIRGESGTGKELFARAIHAESHVRRGPFIAINCAAIPEHLLESELFGYEEGAFTGARRGGKPGRLELAVGGTLFLDEVADLPLYLQAKLLRVLQFRQLERVGGVRTLNLDFRLIAATNRPLEEMIAASAFREDLFYRLNVISLTIPPLRQRPDDLVMFLDLFTKRLCLRLDLPSKRWSAEALSAMLRYRWPGNIRELENVVERAVVLSQGELIGAESLPPELRGGVTALPRSPARSAGGGELSPEQIRAVLARHDGTAAGRAAAARELGLSRATLYRRLKRLPSP